MSALALEALHNIKNVIDELNQITNLDLLGEQVNKMLANYFPKSTWLLLTRESEKNEYIVRSVAIDGHAHRKFHNKVIRIKEGLLSFSIKSNKPILVPKIKTDKRFKEKNDAILGIEAEMENAIFVPIATNTKSHNHNTGLLALYNVSLEQDSNYSLCFCETVGSAIGSVIDYLQHIRDLKREALTDHLTGLHNRRSLVSIVEREIEQCIRYKRYMSFVLIDVDHFKSINDTDGHLHGDAVLVRLAHILQNSVRRLDYVIRFAGDEFVILMPDTLEPQKGEVIRRLRENFERDKLQASVKYSISIGAYSGPPQSLQHMFDAADKEMYRQKKKKHEQENHAVATGNIA